MNVTRTSAAAFTVVFETEEELREEHRVNLAHGALRLPTSESVALHTTLLVTLRGPWGGEAFARATAVAMLPGGIALSVDGNPDEQLARLLAKSEPPSEPDAGAEAGAEEDTPERRQNTWDRMRGLSQMEKLLLAIKAERSERALLLQDNDPRVLLSLLRNPRLTVDEVARIAKSPFLTFQVADVIVKTTQWMSSLDVRLALIRNPKTPPAFALQILPSLPDAEVRSIARAGTSMALKTAALRRLQGKV
ncbi:MAG TPA: hypothetical protein VFV49_14880 [Thermoanaerobaculia bacterium]|nr:hypothetical protein [Thermoanaerobaculia bacterium]